MLNLSLREVKLIAENRDIKGYESRSEDDVLSALKKSEMKNRKKRIEEIRKKFNDARHKFSKTKINKIRKKLYKIENKKDLSASRIKEIKENLLELEKIFLNQKNIVIMMIMNTRTRSLVVQTRSLVVSDLCSETKGSRFDSDC